jgi:hypothetical protein
MLNKYYVLVLGINKSGGNFEEVTRKDTQVEAENLFYDKCSSYGGNAQTGYVVVSVLDTYGRAIKTETIDRLPKDEESEG